MSILLSLGTITVLSTLLILLILQNRGVFENENDNQILDEPQVPNITCGVSFISPFPNEGDIRVKIMRGKEAIPNSFPWMVSLRALRFNRVHVCGGSLIHQRYVLTAAHCLDRYTANDVGVAVGIHFRNESLTDSNTYSVASFKLHERYNTLFKNDDIAIIKLAKPVTFSDNVSTICLPKSPEDDVNAFNMSLITAGWGSTTGANTQANLSLTLQQTSLTVSSNQTFCRQRLSLYNPQRMFCAWDADLLQRSNVCFGDSGGPLMYYKDERFFLYGITSLVLTRMNICSNEEPSYFVKVPAYLDWINDTIFELEKEI